MIAAAIVGRIILRQIDLMEEFMAKHRNNPQQYNYIARLRVRVLSNIKDYLALTTGKIDELSNTTRRRWKCVLAYNQIDYVTFS